MHFVKHSVKHFVNQIHGFSRNVIHIIGNAFKREKIGILPNHGSCAFVFCARFQLNVDSRDVSFVQSL